MSERQTWKQRARSISNLLKCSSWYFNKPSLRLRRAEILACDELTSHANAGNGSCLCTHAIFDE